MSDSQAGRWFEPVAEHAGAAYLRYSFTKGTEQEVAFLVETLDLRPGMRILDVGCGPGRHLHALARRGIDGVGIDISFRFLRMSPEGGRVLADARRLPFSPDTFDAAISLCQGGFGLLGGDEDGLVLQEMARVTKAGGRVAVSAFSAYFAVRHLEEGDSFDAESGVNHEVAHVKNETGKEKAFNLWTTCFTPRELRLLAERAGLAVDAVWSTGPGDYGDRPSDVTHPEFLLVCTAATPV